MIHWPAGFAAGKNSVLLPLSYSCLIYLNAIISLLSKYTASTQSILSAATLKKAIPFGWDQVRDAVTWILSSSRKNASTKIWTHDLSVGVKDATTELSWESEKS